MEEGPHNKKNCHKSFIAFSMIYRNNKSVITSMTVVRFTLFNTSESNEYTSLGLSKR